MKYLLKHILPYTALGLSYVVLSLLIGEVHPFSLVPMYNNFPNYAYAFYVSDEEGKLLPVNTYFNYGAGDLSHNYVAVCESQKVFHGYNRETSGQLAAVGKVMLQKLYTFKRDSVPAQRLQLHRVNYTLTNDSITSKDVLMYEMEL